MLETQRTYGSRQTKGKIIAFAIIHSQEFMVNDIDLVVRF